MNKQRGIAIDLILYGIAAVAIIGGLYGIYAWIDHTWETSAGISRGEAIKQAAWDQANRDAEDAAEAARLERARLADVQSKQLATAQGRAREADTRWRAAQANAGRLTAGCGELQGPAQGAAGADRGIPGEASGQGFKRAPAADPLRFTWDFVMLYDLAWTSPAGEPIYPDSAGLVEAAGGPGKASPYGAQAVLQTHAENASRCSANSRQLTNLIDLLEKLRAR